MLVLIEKKRAIILVQDKVFPVRNDSCHEGDRLASFIVVIEDRTMTKSRKLKRCRF